MFGTDTTPVPKPPPTKAREPVVSHTDDTCTIQTSFEPRIQPLLASRADALRYSPSDQFSCKFRTVRQLCMLLAVLSELAAILGSLFAMQSSLLLQRSSSLWQSYCNQLRKRPLLTKAATGEALRAASLSCMGSFDHH